MQGIFKSKDCNFYSIHQRALFYNWVYDLAKKLGYDQQKFSKF